MGNLRIHVIANGHKAACALHDVRRLRRQDADSAHLGRDGCRGACDRVFKRQRFRSIDIEQLGKLR